MDNVLIFSVLEDIVSLEEACVNAEVGNNILLIQCDQSAGICMSNKLGATALCKLCNKMMLKKAKELNRDICTKSISEYITPDITKVAENMVFKYNNTDELKSITFHGVEIGYGAYSSFVTSTRHCNPAYNDNITKYINALLKMQVRLVLGFENIISEFSPNKIIFHNGRFANFKPLLDLARTKKIPYIATEVIIRGNRIYMNNFQNDVPHSINGLTDKIEQSWSQSDPKSRERLGRSFYENRRNAIWAGDKIYIKNQVKGLLPTDYNSDKENIVIFNSSEDEYMSISSDYDRNRLFINQYIGLKKIFDHYANDNTKHFYLRIHPNLKDVDDISHLALYNLNYKNLTIISADSPINTYDLMDIADKVLVFNSTMGAEAAYWGKPVISMDLCFYSNLQVSYSPQNEEELWKYIDTIDLPNISNIDDLLKIGVHILCPTCEKITHVDDGINRIAILKKIEFSKKKAFTYLGSSIMADLVIKGMRYIPFVNKQFNCLPMDRDLWTADIKN